MSEKEDSKNNFYKAQEQIANALSANSGFIINLISLEISFILPIIVTYVAYAFSYQDIKEVRPEF